VEVLQGIYLDLYNKNAAGKREEIKFASFFIQLTYYS